MGATARSATKIELRNATYNCDICGRRLLSAKAVKLHQDYAHQKIVKLKTKAEQVLSKKKVKRSKSAINKRKSALSNQVAPLSKPAIQSLAKHDLQSNPCITYTTISNPDDMPNVEYECPICVETFPVHFAASLHIQQNHCGNGIDEEFTQDSQNLIKPVLKEVCIKCDKRLSSIEPHFCCKNELDYENLRTIQFYMCSGCRQQFISLTLFDLHVAGMHCDGVKSMFFPTVKEFEAWKDEMESQTKVKYAILDKCTSKKTYHCTFQPDSGEVCNDTTSMFCPSNITVQEFSKGLHIHFYKDHYGHDFKSYVLRNKYKKFSLTALLQNGNGYLQMDNLEVDENDLYLQFKKMMDKIITDAANVNIHTMNILIGKALDMTSVLNNYKEDLEPLLPKCVIGENIILNVNKSNNESVSNQFETDSLIQYRPNNMDPPLNTTPLRMQSVDAKNNMSTPSSLPQLEISETNLNNTVRQANSETLVATEETPNKSDPQTGLLKAKEQQLEPHSNKTPSFSDSYKDFVDKYIHTKPPSTKSKTKAKNSPTATSCLPLICM